MTKYIGRRLLSLIPILIGITFLTFLLMYIAPGDAAQKKLTAQGVAVTQEQIEHTREEMGLNDPFLVQYGKWFGNVLTGDLGTSYKDNMSVSSKLGPAFQRTLILACSSLVLALLVSVTFILMLKLGRLGIPLLGAGLCLAYAVLYFFAETMNVPGILSGICVLALAVLILLAVLGYVPEQKLLLRAGMVALAVRVLLVDLIGYILPLAQWNIIGWVPKASNLFAVVAMVSLCAALKLEKAE